MNLISREAQTMFFIFGNYFIKKVTVKSNRHKIHVIDYEKVSCSHFS